MNTNVNENELNVQQPEQPEQPTKAKSTSTTTKLKEEIEQLKQELNQLNEEKEELFKKCRYFEGVLNMMEFFKYEDRIDFENIKVKKDFNFGINKDQLIVYLKLK